MPNQKHREGLFLLLCLAAAGICAGLAFRFAVPLQAQTPQTLPDTKALAAYTQVELNTADADALCTRSVSRNSCRGRRSSGMVFSCASGCCGGAMKHTGSGTSAASTSAGCKRGWSSV